jgi:hypothetical protein
VLIGSSFFDLRDSPLIDGLTNRFAFTRCDLLLDQILRSNCAGSTRMVGPSLSHGLVDINQSSMSRKFSSANFASTRVPKMCREMSTSRARSSPVLLRRPLREISIQPDLGSISAPMHSCGAGLPFRRVCAIGALPGDFYTAMRGVALENRVFDRRARGVDA